MMGGWGSQGSGFGGMGGFGGIVMILFWGLIIVGAILVIRYFTAGHVGAAGPAGGQTPHQRDPMEILRERYARGDISTEEFEERKKILEGRG